MNYDKQLEIKICTIILIHNELKITCVAAVIETTKEGRLEQLRLTSLPSANKIMRLPSGQIT